MTSSGSGASIADFVRRAVRNAGDNVDRLESLPEEILPPELAQALGVSPASSPPEASYGVQTVTGAIGGALLGYFFGKVSKAAALATGGGILLLQTGVHMGYLSLGTTSDLSRLHSRQDSTLQVRNNIRNLRNRVEPYIRTNPVFLSSFAAGVCLGYGLS